jgi:hypothetical protein
VVAKVREILAVNKQRSYRFHINLFNLYELNEVEHKEQFCVEVSNKYKEQFCVEVSNKFAALEDMDAKVE